MLNKWLIGMLTVVTCAAGVTFADDTELYLVDSTVRTGKRPQVLFIFDNSGSMSTEDQNAVSSYCSAEEVGKTCTYAKGFAEYLAGYSGYINDKGIYWNAGGIDNTTNMPTPEQPNDSRRFYLDNNNCNTAAKALVTKGRYTGYLREFKTQGNTANWVSLAENEGFNQGQVVDCYEDILALDPKNPGREKNGNNYSYYQDGYPVNDKKMYDADPKKSAPEFGKGQPVTLYTSHYLVWYKWVTTTSDGQNSGGTGTRLEVAKDALTSALESLAVPIDAGLAVFNLNYPNEGNADGGRIVYNLTEMNVANKASLTKLINGMPESIKFSV